MDKTTFFGANKKIFTATAPGRLDVMGGIADYSGSLVLEMPIREATSVSIATRDDGLFRIHSAIAAMHNWLPTVEADMQDFLDSHGKPDYASVKSVLQSQGKAEWAAYVIGCVLVLIREKGADIRGGDFWIDSDVPPGKGVSASAALEVATMAALAEAYQVNLGKKELPILCQKAENLIVGAPCGLMDQLTCYLGKRDHLLPILCQPAKLRRPIAIPPSVHFVGIDSGVKHAVSGVHYTKVRTAAFMGYSIIAQKEGVSVSELRLARETGNRSKLPYRGYLANIRVDDFVKKYMRNLPEEMTGSEFLEKYGTTIDPVTFVDENETYPVIACTMHPIYERERVAKSIWSIKEFKQLRQVPELQPDMLEYMGLLMFQAHKSYSLCGLGHEATNEIVTLAKEAGKEKGILGARVTGGGCGGTVCLLCYGDQGLETAHEIAGNIANEQNREPVIFIGSSDGAFYRK